jgi:predicted membrane metal-binding protein
MFIGILLGYILIWNPYLILEHLFIMSALFLTLLVVYLRYVPRMQQAYVSTRRVKVRLLAIAYYVLFDEYLLLLAWRDFLFGRYSVLWEKIDSTRA